MRRLNGFWSWRSEGVVTERPEPAVLLSRSPQPMRRLKGGGRQKCLPHGAAEPQPKRRLEPAVTGETACPTKIVAACKGIRK